MQIGEVWPGSGGQDFAAAPRYVRHLSSQEAPPHPSAGVYFTQVPERQSVSVAHLVVQFPQWVASLLKSTQDFGPLPHSF